VIRPILAIWKKDVKAYLSQPMFYTLAGICLLILAVAFTFQLYTFVTQSFQVVAKSQSKGLNIYHHLIANYVVLTHYVLVFLIATLSLRFFAEEKKMKTFPLYLSSPIHSWQIVLGKWLAGATMVGILVLFTAIYPLSLLFFAKLPLGLVAFSYFGLLLVLFIYMSAAMLASALTDSLIVCVVLALVFNVLILLLGVGRELVDNIFLQNTFSFLSVDAHFGNFKRGVLNVSSIFYFLSFSFFLSFITERVIESHRWR
jgi:ABC-2 type transport system permease protein